MSEFAKYKRIVVKIGTSTLTHEEGHLNLRRIETLVKTLSDFKNAGLQVILVSSGAVSAGVAKVGTHRPTCTAEKQAMAAVGQSELMKLYSRFFSDYGHTVAQILLTKDVIDNPVRRAAAEDTFRTLLEMGCVPIVNENDSISTEGLNFGGNDTLAAYVALVCHADLLINLSDIDGLYDKDPRKFSDAKLISRVDGIDDSVLAMAGGAGTARGTGGMATKLQAARIVVDAGIPMFILNGQDPTILYELMDGKQTGTYFATKQ
ncbi:MAG: glutamate 5-kinase [Clostridia bacterium]|nr:glutamate 5-kinase [Clostridia bacterium]